jgi:hypothetical protein
VIRKEAEHLRMRLQANMKRDAAPIIAAILLLLPVLYVGSYLALVVPGGIPRQGIGSVNGIVVSSISHDNHYRIARDKAEWFFWPLEQIDRKVRPGAWEVPDDPFRGSGRAPVLRPIRTDI